MGEYTVPFQLFKEEWIAIKLKNPLCTASILALVKAIREGEENLDEVSEGCYSSGLSEEFVETVIIAVREPEEHKEYLDLVLKG